MNRAWIVALAVTSGVVGLAPEGSAGGLPRIKGWKPAGPAERYDKKTIWQAINGGAEQFIAYGLREMTQQTLVAGKRRVNVQRYEQGSPLDAFGVYARQLPEKWSDLELRPGAAHAEGGHCLAYKGRTFIKVQPVEGGLDRSTCRVLLAAVITGTSGTSSPPDALALLPARHLVAGTLGYTRESFLGTRHLEHCVHGQYQPQGRTPYTLFVMVPGPGETVDGAWRRLARHWKPQQRGGLILIITEVPYRGKVVLLRREAVILGVAGLGGVAESVALLRGLPDGAAAPKKSGSP